MARLPHSGLAHHGGRTSRRLSPPERFPPSTKLVALPTTLRGGGSRIFGGVVMSHHLESDLHYLRAWLAPVPYVGLLGRPRDGKTMNDLEDAGVCAQDARAPWARHCGRTPEYRARHHRRGARGLAGRAGRPFSETSKSDSSASAAGSER
jgi:hypothetical protein